MRLRPWTITYDPEDADVVDVEDDEGTLMATGLDLAVAEQLVWSNNLLVEAVFAATKKQPNSTPKKDACHCLTCSLIRDGVTNPVAPGYTTVGKGSPSKSGG